MTIHPIGRGGMGASSDDGEYDPNQIYRGASDRHGHSVHFRVACPKHWQGQVEAIVQALDYKSHSEFLRDAIHHRMQWAAEQMDDPNFRSALGMDMMGSQLAQFLNEHEAYEKFKNDIQDAVGRAKKTGDQGEFRKVLDSMIRSAPLAVREPMLSEILNLLATFRRSFE